MKLNKNCNCVYSMFYHLVTVVKYRQKIFTSDVIINDLKIIIEKIGKDFDVDIVEQGFGEDHVHILFKSKPTLNITKFVNILKGHSSRNIRTKHKDFLKDKLWGENFWSSSYFLATSGNVSIDTLKEYIEKQQILKEDI